MSRAADSLVSVTTYLFTFFLLLQAVPAKVFKNIWDKNKIAKCCTYIYWFRHQCSQMNNDIFYSQAIAQVNHLFSSYRSCREFQSIGILTNESTHIKQSIITRRILVISASTSVSDPSLGEIDWNVPTLLFGLSSNIFVRTSLRWSYLARKGKKNVTHI